MSVTHAAPARHAVSLEALWFGLFGAPVAWSLQELISFGVVGHSCYPAWRPLAVPTIDGTWTIALVVTVLTLGLAGAAGMIAWRSWQRTAPPRGDAAAHQAEVGEGRARFMALSGLLVSGMVLFNMILNAVTLFIVPPCG